MKNVKYKARIVVCGCGQVEGVDFRETYAPVTRMDTIRFDCCFLSLPCGVCKPLILILNLNFRLWVSGVYLERIQIIERIDEEMKENKQMGKKGKVQKKKNLAPPNLEE